MVRSHLYLQNLFGVVLKNRGPMLELSQVKHSHILMYNELMYCIFNYIQNSIQQLTILEIKTCKLLYF